MLCDPAEPLLFLIVEDGRLVEPEGERCLKGVECITRINTDILIQAHIPGYLGDNQTWMGRPGWRHNPYRHLPDLRLRCLLALAQVACGDAVDANMDEVESLPVTTPTTELELAFLAQLSRLDGDYWNELTVQSGQTGNTYKNLPPWRTELVTTLWMLLKARDHYATILNLDPQQSFPGRASTRTVNGEYIQWNAVWLYIGRYVHDSVDPRPSVSTHHMTSFADGMCWNADFEREKWLGKPSHEPSNVYDLRQYQRKRICPIRPRFSTAKIVFRAIFQWDCKQRAYWENMFRMEFRDGFDLLQEQLERIKLWQEWEVAGITYISFPDLGRIFLWGRGGSGYPSVITSDSIRTLHENLTRPRFCSALAATFGRALDIARFRYGIPDLSWDEFTSGSFRKRGPKPRNKE